VNVEYQHTLAREFTLSGVGLHTGCHSKITVFPAPANAGISFILSDGSRIPAMPETVRSTVRCTTLASATAEVATVEHLLASLAGMDVDPQLVLGLVTGTRDADPVLRELVSGPNLDADRMDYLLRDSLMTGAKYGIYDLEWIINALAVDLENDRIYVAARGLYAVEEYLQARYYMFRQVYFHRALRSGGPGR